VSSDKGFDEVIYDHSHSRNEKKAFQQVRSDVRHFLHTSVADREVSRNEGFDTIHVTRR